MLPFAIDGGMHYQMWPRFKIWDVYLPKRRAMTLGGIAKTSSRDIQLVWHCNEIVSQKSSSIGTLRISLRNYRRYCCTAFHGYSSSFTSFLPVSVLFWFTFIPAVGLVFFYGYIYDPHQFHIVEATAICFNFLIWPVFFQLLFPFTDKITIDQKQREGNYCEVVFFHDNLFFTQSMLWHGSDEVGHPSRLRLALGM